MTPTPQVLLNVAVRRKPDLDGLPDVRRALEKNEARLNGKGRIVVRYSGTEPLLRIMVEGEGERLIRSVAENLADVVRTRLG